MEELLKKIINIEKDAQQIVREAREERVHFDQAVAAQVRQMESEITQQSELRMKQMEQSRRDAVQEQIDRLRSQTEQGIQKMDALAEQNREDWAQQIFSMVLGR